MNEIVTDADQVGTKHAITVYPIQDYNRCRSSRKPYEIIRDTDQAYPNIITDADKVGTKRTLTMNTGYYLNITDADQVGTKHTLIMSK